MYKVLLIAAVGTGMLAIGVGAGRVLTGLRPQLTSPAVGAHKSAPPLPTVPVPPPSLGVRLRAAPNVVAAARLAYAYPWENPEWQAFETAYNLTFHMQPTVVAKFLETDPDHRLEELTVDVDASIGKKFCYTGLTTSVTRSKEGVYMGYFRMWPIHGMYVKYVTNDAILSGQTRRMCGIFTGLTDEEMLNKEVHRFAVIGAASVVK